MAVPSFDSLMLPVLETLADGEIHRPQEVSDNVAARLGVTAEDQTEMLPSGAMPRYRNRVLWALHYMKRAGVIASPGRGQYVIADSGRALLAEAPAKITTKTLERYPGYLEFMGRSAPSRKTPTRSTTKWRPPKSGSRQPTRRYATTSLPRFSSGCARSIHCASSASSSRYSRPWATAALTQSARPLRLIVTTVVLMA